MYVLCAISKRNFVEKKTDEDADNLIIKSALEMENRLQCVVVVEVFVILTLL